MPKVGNGAHMHPKATKEKGEKKAGAWAPPLLRIDNGNHLHPQATKHSQKKKKKQGA